MAPIEMEKLMVIFKCSFPTLIRSVFWAATLISTYSCQNQIVSLSGDFQFPQGVASADPQSTSVMLWTRVVSTKEQPDSINLKLEISKFLSFQKISQSKYLTAYVKDDYTVRCFSTELDADNKYFYRFIAGKDTSRVGRTFTSPSPNQSASLNFSTLACSSYEQGFFGTLKRLIEEDKSKPESEQIRLIFHLGDFIYEVVGDDPRYDNHSPNWLVDSSGGLRDIAPFPKGKQWPDSDHWKSGSWSPISVDDYRHLYKTYLSNHVMQEARARWPFVYTWDDHEFADGNYQTDSYIREVLGMEGMQQVKVASNQAWFEYLPSTLDQAADIGPVKNQAFDFRPTDVANALLGTEIEEGLLMEPNNLKAINSMRMYRSLTWGKDVTIVVTDTKSYHQPGISVLGKEQKKWFKELLRTSSAKWKLWLNSEPILEAFMDYDKIIGSDLKRSLVYNDAWKVAMEEREELLNHIKKNQISGVVSLSGDYHIQMAATVNAKESKPVMADFAVTAMSSFPDFFWLERRGKNFNDPKLYSLFAYQDNTGKLLPNINTSVLYGTNTGMEMAKSNNFTKALAKADYSVNPYLKYFDCEHNGYLTGKLDSKRLDVNFVNTESARIDHEKLGAEIVSKIGFTLPLWEKGESPELSNPTIEGIVFPFSYQ